MGLFLPVHPARMDPGPYVAAGLLGSVVAFALAEQQARIAELERRLADRDETRDASRPAA